VSEEDYYIVFNRKGYYLINELNTIENDDPEIAYSNENMNQRKRH